MIRWVVFTLFYSSIRFYSSILFYPSNLFYIHYSIFCTNWSVQVMRESCLQYDTIDRSIDMEPLILNCWISLQSACATRQRVRGSSDGEWAAWGSYRQYGGLKRSLKGCQKGASGLQGIAEGHGRIFCRPWGFENRTDPVSQANLRHMPGIQPQTTAPNHSVSGSLTAVYLAHVQVICCCPPPLSVSRPLPIGLPQARITMSQTRTLESCLACVLTMRKKRTLSYFSCTVFVGLRIACGLPVRLPWQRGRQGQREEQEKQEARGTRATPSTALVWSVNRPETTTGVTDERDAALRGIKKRFTEDRGAEVVREREGGSQLSGRFSSWNYGASEAPFIHPDRLAFPAWQGDSGALVEGFGLNYRLNSGQSCRKDCGQSL